MRFPHPWSSQPAKASREKRPAPRTAVCSRWRRSMIRPELERLEDRVTPDSQGPLGQLLSLNKTTFGPNDAVIIDAGKIAYLRPGDHGFQGGTGIADGFFPVADVYVVPAGVAPGAKLFDVSGGKANTVFGGLAGTFGEQIIAFTRPGGKLDAGAYAVVYDEDQNGEVNGDYDAVFDNAFTVVIPPNLPILQNPSLLALKLDWANAAGVWKDANIAYGWLFDAVEVLDFFESLNSGGSSGLELFLDLTTEAIGNVLGSNPRELAVQNAIDMSTHYLGLAGDPPDPDFRRLAPLAAAPAIERLDNDPLRKAIFEATDGLRFQSAAADALLHAMERYQGAQEGANAEWALIHARAVRDNAALLRGQLALCTEALQTLRDTLAGDPRDVDGAAAKFAAHVAQVFTTGFSAAELREFRNLGLSPSQVDDLRLKIAALHPFDGSRSATVALLNGVIAANIAQSGRLAAVESGMQGIVAFLESDFSTPKRAPVAIVAGPYTTAEGLPTMLDGSASTDPDGSIVAWNWDLDLDGQFDDAAGARPTVSFAQAFDGLIGLRVTDNNGRTGIAYARMTVSDTNSRPVIQSVLPTPLAVDVTLGGQLAFRVTASDADPITVTWFVDNQAAGNGPSFAYAPTGSQKIGVHVVRVDVADNHPSGGRAVHEWTVTVHEADADGDGWTANIDFLDNNPAVNPGMTEVVGNGLDDDCNPSTPDYGVLDLVITQVGTAGLTTNVQTLEATGTVAVTVTNRGTSPLVGTVVGPVKVLLFEDRNADGKFQADTDNFLGTATMTTDIAAGGSAILTAPVHTIMLFRDNLIGAIVDPDNTIPEVVTGGEANNTGHSGEGSRYQPTSDWLPMVQWQWTMPPTGSSAGPGALATVAPLIDTNGDGRINARDIPAVVVNTTSNSSDGTIRLTALRGDSGQVIFSVVNPVPARSIYALSAPTVADLDADGKPEILLSAIATDILYCFNNDGTLKWQSQHTPGGFWNTFPVPVDLDGDAKSEILYGTAALNGEDGTVQWDTGRLPLNGVGDLGGPGNFSARLAADLNLDGLPEVVAGRSVLDRNGQPVWAWQTAFNPANGRWIAQRSINGGPWVSQFESDVFLGDGYAAVANLDSDPNPEAIVISPQRFGVATGTGPSMWVFNHDGSLYQPPVPLAQDVFNQLVNYSGPPTVADFDGDGRPEIAFTLHRGSQVSPNNIADPRRDILYVIETNGTEVWHKDLTPTGNANQFVPPPAAFDFDGDGSVELVVQDRQYLYILDGHTGATRWQTAIGNESTMLTGLQPIVADTGNFGGARIMAYATQSFGVGSQSRQGIIAIGDANDNWIHARRDWHQWMGHPAFVNEDNSVPAHARNSWAVQNGVRTQIPIEGVDRFAAPDLSVSRVTVDGSNCPASAGLTARVGNGGSLQAGAGIRVAFYLGDPVAGGTLLGNRTTSRPLFPGEFEDVTFNWLAPVAGQVYVTVNDQAPAARVASANLSLLPDAWARSSGFLADSSVPMNRNAYLGIDGNPNTRWTLAGGTDTDPGPHFIEVHFPFPVDVTGVTIQNQGSGTTGLLGIGTLTFSDGSTITIDLGTTGAGTVTFPQKAGITWIMLTASAVASGGPGLSEFIVAGSYIPPTFLNNEGAGKRGNNVAAAGPIGLPCDPAADFTPTVYGGSDRTINEDGTIALTPALFTDPGLLSPHTATIDWGDGSPVAPGAVIEAGGSGTVAGSHLYRESGTYTVTVRVADLAGHAGAGLFTVQVQNLPATVTTGPDRTAAEGDVVNVSASFTDLGTLDTHTATINWGDGTVEPAAVTEAGGAGTATGAHVYRDNGRYTVTVSVRDDEGAAASKEFGVQVANRAPVVEAGSGTAINEGGAINLVGAGFSDAGLADAHIVSIDWGDGTPYGVGLVTGTPAGATIRATHVYGDNGTFTVTVFVTDDDGAVASDTFQVVVANVAPVVFVGAERTVGSRLELSPASFRDPSVLDKHVATVDWGDGVVESGNLFQWRGSGTVGGAHTYLTDGTYTVRVAVTDDDGGVGQASFHVHAHVINQPPQVLTEGTVNLVEGDEHEFTFGFTDANPNDVHTATINWGDGSLLQVVPLANELGGFGTAFAKHRYVNHGNRVATFTVSDDRGLSGVGTVLVTVIDPAPSAVAGGPYVVSEGGVLALSAAGSSDPDNDPLTYSWDVNGDGVFGDASGVEPTLTWAQLVALGITDGPRANSVRVRVSDGTQSTESPATFLTVGNSPPAAGLAGPASGPRGQVLPFVLTAADPSSTDQSAGFSFRIDWGDGTPVQSVAGPSGASVGHAFAASGGYTIRVTAEDKDGGVSVPVTLPVSVVGQVTSTVAVTSSANPALVGRPVTFTVTIASAGGSGMPTGSVQFQLDGVILGASQPLVAGAVRMTTSALPAGNHVVTAVYGGDGNYLPGSGQVTQAIRYDFGGFRPPLRPGDQYNLGRDLPIKFRLSDFAGNTITALTAVRSLRIQRLDEAGNALGLPFDPASADGQGLRVTDGQFHFNWKTTGLTAGRYRIVLELDDGTTWTLDLRFA